MTVFEGLETVQKLWGLLFSRIAEMDFQKDVVSTDSTKTSGAAYYVFSVKTFRINGISWDIIATGFQRHTVISLLTGDETVRPVLPSISGGEAAPDGSIPDVRADAITVRLRRKSQIKVEVISFMKGENVIWENLVPVI